MKESIAMVPSRRGLSSKQLAAIAIGAAVISGAAIFGVVAATRTPEKRQPRWDDEPADRGERDDVPRGAKDMLAAAPTVDVKILTDARCPDCDTERFEKTLSTSIRGARITIVDYMDPAGAVLWSVVRPSGLPAIVLETPRLPTEPAARAWFESAKKVDSRWVVRGTGTWDPECADPGGCSRSQCAGKTICRPETPGTLDLFMTGRCKIAARTLRTLEEVMKNFTDHGARFTVHVHFIAEDQGGGRFRSVRGPAEVDEALRDVCVAKHYEHAFLDYLYCRAADPDAHWTECTTANARAAKIGVHKATIDQCVERLVDGPSLLAASIRETDAFGVETSPTVLINGRYAYTGHDADALKDAICAHNTLAGCGMTLSRVGRPN